MQMLFLAKRSEKEGQISDLVDYQLRFLVVYCNSAVGAKKSEEIKRK